MWPIIGAFVPILKDLIGLIPSGERRAEMLKSIQTMELELAKGQLEVNAEEAKSSNWFVAGWRPATGWMCNFGLFWNVVVAPSLGQPQVGMDLILPLLFGMLGLGGLRTFEKVKGIK